MNFLGITQIFSIIILLNVDVTLAVCPKYQTPHIVDARTVCCKPAFKCGKDHEIIYCTEDGGQDECRPCQTGEINSYMTSSLDTKRYVCFKKTRSHEDCPIEDNYPTAETESCENMYCRCITEDCRYGDVCNMCYKRTEECGVNEEINAVTGECEPCKALMKSSAGCGPCQYDETAWRISEEMKQTNGTSISQKGTTKVTGHVVTDMDVPIQEKTGDTGYIIVSDKPSNGTADQSNDDSFSMTPVIIIIVVVLLVGIVVAVCLYAIKKLKSGDSNSRLVVLYNKLNPNNRFMERAQQDPESPVQNGNVPYSDNADARQTQAVAPMRRQTEDTIEEAGEDTCEGAACSEPARMALLKNEDTCGNEGEETTQKQTTDEHQS